MKAKPKGLPAKWAWHYRTLMQLRERLAGELAEHNLAARCALEKGGADLGDRANDELEHDALFAALSLEEDKMAEVDAALARIRDGSYGKCEVSGERISAARLRVLPWTRFSQAIAARREAARAPQHDFLAR